MEFVLATTGRRRLLVTVPFGLASSQGAFFEILSNLCKPPLTRDQVAMLRRDTVVSEAALREGRTFKELGVEPVAMEAIVPTYLWRFRKAGQFSSKTA